MYPRPRTSIRDPYCDRGGKSAVATEAPAGGDSLRGPCVRFHYRYYFTALAPSVFARRSLNPGAFETLAKGFIVSAVGTRERRTVAGRGARKNGRCRAGRLAGERRGGMPPPPSALRRTSPDAPAVSGAGYARAGRRLCSAGNNNAIDLPVYRSSPADV